MRGGGAAEDRPPANDANADESTRGEALCQVVGRPLAAEVGEVEDTGQPGVLVGTDAGVVEKIEHGAVGQRLLVDVLQQVGAAKQRHQQPVDTANQPLLCLFVLEELF